MISSIILRSSNDIIKILSLPATPTLRARAFMPNKLQIAMDLLQHFFCIITTLWRGSPTSQKRVGVFLKACLEVFFWGVKLYTISGAMLFGLVFTDALQMLKADKEPKKPVNADSHVCLLIHTACLWSVKINPLSLPPPLSWWGGAACLVLINMGHNHHASNIYIYSSIGKDGEKGN